MFSKKFQMFLIVGAMSLGLLTACGTPENAAEVVVQETAAEEMATATPAEAQETAPEATEAPKEMVDVSLRLAWIINAQAAGPLAALEQGYFAEEGLNVTINAGGPDANSIILVAAGENTFGLHDTGSLLTARAENMPLITVATFWQKHPGCVFTLESTGIKTLKDFEGKRLGFKEGGPWVLTQAMLKANEVDLDSIQKLSVGFGIAPIMEGDVDLLTGFCTNEPLAVKREGKPVVTFLPYDNGIETSTEALFTTEEYLAKNPDVVAGMVRAIRRGWEYALANKEDAVNYVLKYGGEELNFDAEMEQLSAQESFILTPDAEKYGIGYMTEARWQMAKQVLVDQGLLDPDIDVTDAYTMEFITP